MTGVQTSQTQAALSPDDVVAELVEGNRRFASGERLPRVLLDQVRATAGGQYPMAAIVSCIDSRVPPEMVFDLGLGDAFALRSAGNVVDGDVLGGLEFAVEVAGVKVVVVLGHSRCGAVKGACDGVELGHLTGLLAKITPAVHSVAGGETLPGSGDAAIVQQVVEANVHQVVDTISSSSDVLAARIAAGDITVVGAVYDIETAEVTFLG